MPISPICIDASVVIPLLMEPAHAIQRQWAMWHMSEQIFVAPELLRYEVANGLHRYTVSRQRSLNVVDNAIRTLVEMPISYLDEPNDSLRAVALARRFDRPATYDTHYLALAERLGVEFWTADRRLVNSVGPEFPWVHLVGEPAQL